MFRTAFLRASRTIGTTTLRPVVATAAAAAPRPALMAAPKLAYPAAVRCYSAPAAMSEEEVEGRITALLKGFDKVTDQSKITNTAHFTTDLGLDSLDTVEVVMAIEEEFSIEIPDKEADAIQSVGQAVKYIRSQPDAH